jgi:hypothetical protein
MLVVIASAADEHAACLLPHFRRLEPLLLTPADLSKPGWQLRTDRPGEGSLIASGRQIRLDQIDGVLTRLPVVFPQELVAIDEPDRVYAAQEMTAFLRYFLTSLRCPVLNRATPGSLCGPMWRRERWQQLAASCGLPTEVCERRGRRTTGGDESREPRLTVTLIGDEMLDDVPGDIRASTRALARAASVHMLSVSYLMTAGAAVFCRADACPSLSEPRSAHLIEECIVARGAFA